jgi:hypothetical protein
MSMGPGQMAGDVAARAQLVRLDVYDSGAHCDGARVADGAPAPTLTRDAGAGQPIKLDVPAGHHVLLLSAFSDATGTELLGSACVETDVRANQPACFNLSLAEAPDAAMAPGDDLGGGDMTPVACTISPDNCPSGQYCASDGNCAAGCKSDPDCAATAATPHCHVADHRCVECLVTSDCAAGKECSPSGSCVDGCVASAPNCAAGDQCCSMLCIDVATDLSNCGACGRACASSNVTTPGCSNDLCAPKCAAGWADCNHPVAPNADDGCETNVYNVAHCGACGAAACSLPNATPDCPAGACVVKSCSANYFDCDAKAANGCECPGVDLGGGAGACCAGGKCQTAHNSGVYIGAVQQTFYTCSPAGTIDEPSAHEAALQYANPGGTPTLVNNTCPAGTTSWCSQTTTTCACWGYAGSGIGLVLSRTGSTCYCPSSGNGVAWN